MRRRILAAILCLATVAAPAACGVPTGTAPVPVGKAPGFGGDVESPAVKLPEPDGAPDALTLVRRFLQAAAKGDWDPASSEQQRITQATEHARLFLTDVAARGWQPGGRIFVVEWVSDEQRSAESVTVRLRGVGVLAANGAIDPLAEPLDMEHTFTAERSAASGEYRLTDAPPNLLLSTEGLREMYHVRPVYFWDKRDRYLVPDRRYLSRGASRDKRIRAVVDRLVKGPSKFLETWVNTLPINTSNNGNPVVEGSTIVVNLSSAVSVSDKAQLSRIATQLRWSLHPEKLALELEIDGRTQDTYGSDSYLLFNPSANPADQATRLYVVADGRVVQQSTGARVPTVLEAAANSNVVTAAVNGVNNSAALVRRNGTNRELWIGDDRETTAAQLVRVPLPPTAAMTRPSCLPDTPNRVLVASGGAVYDVSDDGAFRTVPDLAGVTALAVAPDGSRVAFVSGDSLFVATLDSSAVPASVGQPRPLYTPGLTGLRGVAWTYEHQLVVVSATEVMEVAIDNGYRAVITPPSLFAQQITQVASAPRTTADRDVRGLIVLDVGGKAHYLFASGIKEIESPLVTPAPSGSPEPSPSGSRAPPAPPTQSAPFFMEVVS